MSIAEPPDDLQARRARCQPHVGSLSVFAAVDRDLVRPGLERRVPALVDPGRPNLVVGRPQILDGCTSRFAVERLRARTALVREIDADPFDFRFLASPRADLPGQRHSPLGFGLDTLAAPGDQCDETDTDREHER